MHVDMPHREQDAIMAEFRSGTTRDLITTDVWVVLPDALLCADDCLTY